MAGIPDSQLTGHPRQRLCHHASFVIRGVEGQAMVIDLDQLGIAASSAAACQAGEAANPVVLAVMGIPDVWGIGSLRLTLGRSTGEVDVDRLLDVLPGVVARLRSEEH